MVERELRHMKKTLDKFENQNKQKIKSVARKTEERYKKK